MNANSFLLSSILVGPRICGETGSHADPGVAAHWGARPSENRRYFLLCGNVAAHGGLHDATYTLEGACRVHNHMLPCLF